MTSAPTGYFVAFTIKYAHVLSICTALNRLEDRLEVSDKKYGFTVYSIRGLVSRSASASGEE